MGAGGTVYGKALGEVCKELSPGDEEAGGAAADRSARRALFEIQFLDWLLLRERSALPSLAAQGNSRRGGRSRGCNPAAPQGYQIASKGVYHETILRAAQPEGSPCRGHWDHADFSGPAALTRRRRVPRSRDNVRRRHHCA